jgi:glutamine amidotransferase
MKTVIIDYGAGNVFSVQSALSRLGVKSELTNDKNEILTADRVVFPGVGHAVTALKQLREKQLDQLIPLLKQPVLGVCLGMQLMCEHTQEGNENGLGIFEGVKVKRFDGVLKIPHIGWNNLTKTSKKMEG